MLTVVVTPAQSEATRALLATLPAHRAKVRLREAAQPTHADDADVVVTEAGVALPWDWADQRPPTLLPTLPLSAPALSAMLSLAAHDEVAATTALPALTTPLTTSRALAEGLALPPRGPAARDYLDRHNLGACLHYSADAPDLDAALTAYTDAMRLAPSAEARAFTARQAITLLLDTGRLDEADAVRASLALDQLPAAAQESLEGLRLAIALEQLSPVTPAEQLAPLAAAFEALADALDARGNTLRAALLRLDESRVLQLAGRFADGRDVIAVARAFFAEAESPELVATADLRRGELLHAWAQSGARHQFKFALEAFQQALAVFTKDVAPSLFGAIHHELAILYAEMPGDPQQRPIMLALSGGSFQAALEIWTADESPDMHARICANYGNALMRCPESQLRDPVDRAIEQFRRALVVGRDVQSDTERGITLLNLLEALTQQGWTEGDAAAEAARREEIVAVLGALSALTLPDALAEEVGRRRAQFALVLADPVVTSR